VFGKRHIHNDHLNEAIYDLECDVEFLQGRLNEKIEVIENLRSLTNADIQPDVFPSTLLSDQIASDISEQTDKLHLIRALAHVAEGSAKITEEITKLEEEKQRIQLVEQQLMKLLGIDVSISYGDANKKKRRNHKSEPVWTDQARAEFRVKYPPVCPPEATLDPGDDQKMTCLIDGKRVTFLKQHLTKNYGMPFSVYSTIYELPVDYPMTPPAHQVRMSQIAKKGGLGKIRDKSATNRSVEIIVETLLKIGRPASRRELMPYLIEAGIDLSKNAKPEGYISHLIHKSKRFDLVDGKYWPKSNG
jgi:predicted transcriptional regulator